MERVLLNVGGVCFESTNTTLRSKDSFFGPLIANRTSQDLFIDRDPTHFRHILNFLRGSPSFPSTLFGLDELRAEADFYCLSDLQGMIEEKRRQLMRSSVAHQLEMLGTKLQR